MAFGEYRRGRRPDGTEAMSDRVKHARADQRDRLIAFREPTPS